MTGYRGQTLLQPFPVMSSSGHRTSIPTSMTELEIGKHSHTLPHALHRDNVLEATLLHLTERFNGKEVYLVGTMNQSTMLAQRTRKLIDEVKPDAVYVQTS